MSNLRGKYDNDLKATVVVDKWGNVVDIVNTRNVEEAVLMAQSKQRHLNPFADSI